MSKPRLFLRLGLITASGLYAASAFPQSSLEYAQMATAAWSAFECSSLASVSGNAAEQERLFLYGYDKGKTFITAAQSEKIEEEDLSREAPLIMLMLLQGPSADFMLGRVFESAQESALEEVYGDADSPFNESDRKLNAENKFRRQNCALIGK